MQTRIINMKNEVIDEEEVTLISDSELYRAQEAIAEYIKKGTEIGTDESLVIRDLLDELGNLREVYAKIRKDKGFKVTYGLG